MIARIALLLALAGCGGAVETAPARSDDAGGDTPAQEAGTDVDANTPDAVDLPDAADGGAGLCCQIGATLDPCATHAWACGAITHPTVCGDPACVVGATCSTAAGDGVVVACR